MQFYIGDKEIGVKFIATYQAPLNCNFYYHVSDFKMKTNWYSIYSQILQTLLLPVLLFQGGS